MASEHVISINAGGQRYSIIMQRGLMGNIGSVLRAQWAAAAPTKAAVVADANVAKIYLARLEQSLRSVGFEPLSVIIPAGEQSKSLASLAHAYDTLLPHRIERRTPVIGLGGGMITDLAGFAAATLLRGLPYIPVPTSLLAMVDASIGGKTAVNHCSGKNLIGAFHQPAAVLIDPDVLATLPPRELRNGMAEVIKHYVIRDAGGFARLESSISCVLSDIEQLTQMIAENVAIKARIVESDPFEQGERAHLNFGHTFGHGFEHASNYTLSHGEAVALGMCAAAHAAVELGMLDEGSAARIRSLVTAADLPTRAGGIESEQVLLAMTRDKKVQHGRMRLVLPERIGMVVIRDDVPEAVVMRSVAAVIG